MGSAAEDQKLVLKGEVFEEQISTGLEPGMNQTKRDGKPTDHAAQDLQERPRTQEFSGCTEFLPSTSQPVDPDSLFGCRAQELKLLAAIQFFANTRIFLAKWN